MKPKLFAVLFVAFCTILLGAGTFGLTAQSLQAPSVFIPNSRYNFSPVLDGTEITHDFVIQNKGDAPLAIEKVRTGWGCTAVSYPRQIPPGGEGKIVIKVDTTGYGGKTVTKKIMVRTNSADHSEFYLTVIGNVENFVTVVPERVTLRGPAGHPIKATAKIIPEKKYPFKITSVSVVNKKNIGVKLEKDQDSTMTSYLITVENRRKTKGRYFDTIKLKTDSKIRPEIKIYVIGNII